MSGRSMGDSQGRGDFRGGSAGGGHGGGGKDQKAIRVFPNPQSQDRKVTEAENSLHSTTKTLKLDSLRLTEGFPRRPGYGTKGAQIELMANYVELLPPSDMVLHRYDIQISLEAPDRKHFRLVQQLLQSEDFAPHSRDLVTDFRSTLLSKTRFPDDETIDIQYRSEGEVEPAAGATTYKARFLYTKTLNITVLTNYLNSMDFGQALEDKQELMQALKIFLNHYSKSTNNVATIGATKSFSLYQNPTREDLGLGLEVIRGFFSSVRVATCRMLVNINVSHAAFFKAGPLQALMNSYGVQKPAALEKFLKLVRVRTTHLPERRNKAKEVIHRIKTIFGLARTDDGHRRLTHFVLANMGQVPKMSSSSLSMTPAFLMHPR